MTIQLLIFQTTHHHVRLPVVAFLAVHLQIGLLIVVTVAYLADVQKIGEDQASRIPFRSAVGAKNLSEGWRILTQLGGTVRITTCPRLLLPLAGNPRKIPHVVQKIANVNANLDGDRVELSALVGQAIVRALLILPRARRLRVA
jgi:hypothetical protein